MGLAARAFLTGGRLGADYVRRRAENAILGRHMELNDFVLALNPNLYKEMIRFYNESKTFAHVQDPSQKRSLCRKIVEHFSNPENMRTFLRNNFTSQSEEYFETLILSNPLNSLIKIENEENLKKIENFYRCGFLYKIKKDYFAVPDEIFKICFEYFNKNRKSTGTAEIREYMPVLPATEFSYKMSRSFLDPYVHFMKYLFLSLARDITGSEKAASLLEESIKELRGKAPMADTMRKFLDSVPLFFEIRKQKNTVNLFARSESLSDTEWLEVQVSRFLRDFAAGLKGELPESFLKKMKSDSYFNIKSLPYGPAEIDPLIKVMMCCGAAEVIYSDSQPVYVKLSPFGEKVFNILFPIMETLLGEVASRKKPHKKSAVMTPDFNLMTDSQDISIFVRTLCFSDLISADGVYMFNITRDSIVRSISLGMNFFDFKNFISRNVKGEPPENVMTTVRDWYYSVIVSGERKCVMISLSGTAEKLLEIDRDPLFLEHIMLKIKNAQYLVVPEKVETIRDYFKNRSIPLICLTQ